MQFHGPIELSVQRADKYIEIPLERAETTTTATSKISNQVNAPADDKESKISSGSSLNGKPKPNVPPKIVNKKPPTRQVTETDLYLLGAIEKLVYRVDFMEKRLRRVEEMMYFMMAGNRIDEVPCADNFTRVNHQCYFFASNAGRELDWKAASKHCQRLGAALVELESIEENQDIVTYLQSNSQLRGKDFWTSGLNPGLLWIWSGSARPVATTDKNKKPTTLIAGDGRCLRLTYDAQLRSYAYRGTDCSVRYHYICEKPDTAASNEVRRLGRMRDIFKDDADVDEV
ncbi:uncharacterized protein [Atheta coriaria]